MLNFSLKLLNPFCKEYFENIFCTAWQLSKNKFLEFEITYFSKTIIDIDFSITTKCDHAGVSLEVGILCISMHINLYDSRHWNETTDAWKIYYPDGTTDDPDDI